MTLMVCSNKPRPSVGTRKNHGAGAWSRDMHHFSDDKKRTLCGINCTEWLTIDEPIDLTNPDNCPRCRAKDVARLAPRAAR